MPIDDFQDRRSKRRIRATASVLSAVSGIKKQYIQWLLMGLVALLAYAGLAPPGNSLSGTASVIDGDTIEIHGQRIRFYGIDAPESQQLCEKDGKDYLCGKEAAFALSDEIGGKPVSCEEKDVDQYRRIVAICSVGGEDLNRWMVAHGHALAYRSYSTRYVRDEENAKAARLAIWQGRFQKPWDYRHSNKHVYGSKATQE